MRSNITRAQASLEMACGKLEADTVTSGDLTCQIAKLGPRPKSPFGWKELATVTKKSATSSSVSARSFSLKLMDFIERHLGFLAAGIALWGRDRATDQHGSDPGPDRTSIGRHCRNHGVCTCRPSDGQKQGLHTERIPQPFELAQDAVEITRIFFQLFIDTIQAIAGELSDRKSEHARQAESHQAAVAYTHRRTANKPRRPRANPGIRQGSP